MACNALTGIPLDCSGAGVKGIKTIYIADLEDVDTVTVTNGNVSAITMASSPADLFYKYEIRKNNGSNYVESQEDPTAGFDGWNSVITTIFNRRALSKRNEIQVLAEGFRNLAIIVLDLNGIYWLFGATNRVDSIGGNGLNLTATTGGSEDGSYTLTFTGMEIEQAYTVNSSVIATII